MDTTKIVMTKPVELEESAEVALGSGTASKNEGLLDKPIEVCIALPTQAYFISGIRDFTLSMTMNLTGFSKKWAFRFQAIVDELCNNAIEHGSAPGQLIKIKFVSVRNTSIEVTVEDTGTSNEKMTAEQLTALLKERKQMMTRQYTGFRGRGLPKIVAEWTDEVTFENAETGGIRVKVKKYLRKEEDTVSSTVSPTHIVLNN